MLALERLPITIRWTADQAGRMTFFNSDWARYTGTEARDVQGSAEKWIDFIHPDDRARVLALWAQRPPNSDRYALDFRLLGEDGVFRRFSGVAVPIRVSDDVATWAGYCEPIA